MRARGWSRRYRQLPSRPMPRDAQAAASGLQQQDLHACVTNLPTGEQEQRRVAALSRQPADPGPDRGSAAAARLRPLRRQGVRRRPRRGRRDDLPDGHDLLRAVVRYRGPGEREWREAPMHRIDAELGGDRWAGSFTVDEQGRWEWTVEAWTDVGRAGATSSSARSPPASATSAASCSRARRCSQGGDRAPARRDRALIEAAAATLRRPADPGGGATRASRSRRSSRSPASGTRTARARR